ncbi:MAG: beta-propeller domain-containing protein [Thermodesulfobacteriota bacterium]|nr:beta-propeller domain-containing protein [Thermodesulfobacteriota bacterium]
MKIHLIFRTTRDLFIAAILFGFFSILGCAGGGTEIGNPDTFSDSMELEVYLKDQFASSVISYEAPLSEVSLVDSLTGDPIPQFSQTNVQEAGVDEADKVKTDGTYLYVADDQAVHIVKAVPADSMSVISTISVNGAVDTLYLYKDLLIVIYLPKGGAGSSWMGTDLVGNVGIGMPYWIPIKSQTGVLIVDVKNPSSPEWVEEIVTDGWQVSSRLTGGKLHIVQQFLPNLPPLQLRYDGTEEGLTEAIAANYQSLDTVTFDKLIPSYDMLDENGNQIEGGPLVAPQNFYRPNEPGGGSIVTILTFNLEDISGGFQSVGLVADAHTVYASTQALYVAANRWNNGSVSTDTDIDDRYYQTVLHKFTLTKEHVMLEGSGKVSGKILNQFSLGEYQDVLRIATTTGDFWREPVLNNNFYCLTVKDNRLKIIGKLENLAPGESIYSARFIGPRGFLVTFVKVDPLFTLDLSDPTAPQLVGELKVPGYSDYIHPLGEDHLITIGKDTEEYQGTAYYQGVQLSIFDISDFADPKLLHKEVIGDRGTTSEALYDHKAFTFWEENGLLAIPVDLFEHETEPNLPYSNGINTFSGLYVYGVTVEDGFDPLGRISTDSAIGGWYYDYNWLRGVFIDEGVYAVNYQAVRSADIEDIEGTVNTLIINDEH